MLKPLPVSVPALLTLVGDESAGPAEIERQRLALDGDLADELEIDRR